MVPTAVAREIDAEVRSFAPSNTAQTRAIRRRWTKTLRTAGGSDVLHAAFQLLEGHGHRFLAYELIRFHPGALSLVDANVAERLGTGMASWGDVDMFGTLVAGQAWRRGHVDDETIHGWARRTDRWWRRAALVSTVPLNVKNQGGSGDPARTLLVCQMLVDDRDDMVVKALSWALRELVACDRTAVEVFLDQHPGLAARVHREVTNKLTTGLKGRAARQGNQTPTA